MNFVAWQMLTGDRAKYAGLVFAIAFSTFLMSHQMSIFVGLLNRTRSQIKDIADAGVWVMDPKTEYLDEVDLPAEEIAAVIASTGARAVALSLVYPAGDPAVAEEIRSLRSCVPEEVALIIGGRAAASYMPLFDPAGVVYLDKISGLPKTLNELQ
jgi:hypothetical protein